MKKSGFTLAEVLITLGIVGVVSALVLPTFTTKMQTAKIGPKLAKAVAGFEQANIAILEDAQSDTLRGAVFRDGNLILHSAQFYLQSVLPTHMKGAYNNTTGRFYSADGISYCIVEAEGRTVNYSAECDNGYGFTDVDSHDFPHQTPIAGFKTSALMIDIDGDNGPSNGGRDRFYFQLMDDGSLRPWGGSWEPVANNRWDVKGCLKNAVPTNYALCAGHVMENGLKVEYK